MVRGGTLHFCLLEPRKDHDDDYRSIRTAAAARRVSTTGREKEPTRASRQSGDTDDASATFRRTLETTMFSS